MLQALRGCIEGAGSKMGDKVRKELTATLEGLLSVNPDVTRTTAAACLGVMCGVLADEELMLLLNLHLLGTTCLTCLHYNVLRLFQMHFSNNNM